MTYPLFNGDFIISFQAIALAGLIGVGMAACTKVGGTATQTVALGDTATAQAAPRAFLDFSGYTGPPRFTSHQPPASLGNLEFTLPNGISGSGLRVSHQGDGAAVTISRYGDGMAAQSGDYMYFFIDNDDVRNAGVVTLAITFFDDSSGTFDLQYVREGDDYYRKSFPKGGTNTYITVKVELDNCNFTSGHNQGAQFRFNRDAVIQRVEMITGNMGDPLSDPLPVFAAATALNNMIGKGITGYQAWFKAPGSNWHHWGGNGRPGPGNVNVELWPAGWEDYLANGAALHDTGFVMPDGSAARLFNSHDAAIIRTQLKWMRDAGLDGAAVQRFFADTSDADTGDAPNHLTVIRDAAGEHDRIFYVMYDLSGAGLQGNPDQAAVLRRIRLDWIYNIERKGIASSPNYAQAEGKPVVCLWGVHANESTDNYRYISVDAAIELIRWFRDRGYYVIGGIPDDVFWEQGGGRHPRGREMYSLFDMISPWYIGRDVLGQILGGGRRLLRALEFCRDNPRSWAGNQPLAFMPTVWPGFAWTNMNANPGTPNQIPREGGQWIWTQIQGYLNGDTDNVIRSFYFAMLDEYDEATNWMKAAVDFYDIPLDQYFLTHAADGKWLSSDYYIRMANAASGALQRKLAAGGGSNAPGTPGYTGPLNDYTNQYSVIVEHSEGPVFWRNSFERRSGRLKHREGQSDLVAVPVHHLQVDVGVPNGGVMGNPLNVMVTGAFTVNRPALRNNATSDNYSPPSETLGMIYSSNAKSGGSVFRLAGQRSAGNGASYLYRIAETRIKAGPALSLSFWQRAENPLGENILIDLLLDSGVYLSSVAGYNLRNDGAPEEGWQKKTVDLPAATEGRYITAVVATYRDDGNAADSFAALIDDITIYRR